MNWQNLKKMQCPKCKEQLVEKSNRFECTETTCGFIINRAKFESIVNSLYSNAPRQRPAVMEEQDNFSRLQNMEEENDHCNDNESDDLLCN